jgi:hypothetical protein
MLSKSFMVRVWLPGAGSGRRQGTAPKEALLAGNMLIADAGLRYPSAVRADVGLDS